jgi:hypothetical protein
MYFMGLEFVPPYSSEKNNAISAKLPVDFTSSIDLQDSSSPNGIGRGPEVHRSNGDPLVEFELNGPNLYFSSIRFFYYALALGLVRNEVR